MIILILTIHLALAATYTVFVTGLGFAAILRKSTPSVYKSIVASFAATLVSGVGVAVASPKAVGQLCVSVLVASLVGLMVAKFYKQRVTTVHVV